MSTPIAGLGEIGLRVSDLEEMAAFYGDVIGLPVLRRFESIVFFEVAPGVAGHTQVLALFDRPDEETPDAARSTLDHLAFAIPPGAFEDERDRLESCGLDVETAVHEWVGWRSLYVEDPEENQVELVCRDPELEVE